MLAQKYSREPSHTQETRTSPKDMLAIRPEIEEKFQHQIFKAVFRYWTLRSFSKQFNLDCENFNQYLEEDQHKFGALMFCPQDLPIHIPAFLKNFSKWINKTHFNHPGFQSFRIKNSVLPDSIIEKETLMIFQVTRKRMSAENLFVKFEKTKGKFERFLQKNPQLKIRKVVFFIVSSQKAEGDDKEVRWLSSDFVGGIPFEFGGILHLPPQLYFEEPTGFDKLLKTFFEKIHQLEQETNNKRLLLHQEGQLQADFLQRERENIAREKEEISKEREEINREKEEMNRQREEIRKEREELHTKRQEIPGNQQIDLLTHRFSGLMREQNQLLYQAQPNIPPQTQAWELQNLGYSALQPHYNTRLSPDFNQIPVFQDVNIVYIEPSSEYPTTINANLPNSQSDYHFASEMPTRGQYGEPVEITPFDYSVNFTSDQAQIAHDKSPWDDEFI